MKTTLKFFGAAALATGFALPALAAVDAGTMTCGAYFAMDAAGKGEATNAVVAFVTDTANSAAAGTAAETVPTMSASEVQAQIDKACEGKTVDTNLISVLQ